MNNFVTKAHPQFVMLRSILDVPEVLNVHMNEIYEKITTIK